MKNPGSTAVTIPEPAMRPDFDTDLNGTSSRSPLIPFCFHLNFLGRNGLRFKHDNAMGRLGLFRT